VIRQSPKEPYKGLKRTLIRKVSKKMVKQHREENNLSIKLAELSGNCCEICGQYKPLHGLHKHEIIRRGQQGDELDPLNTLLLGGCCHNHRKYPKTGTPLTIEEQQKLAFSLHHNIVKGEI